MKKLVVICSALTIASMITLQMPATLGQGSAIVIREMKPTVLTGTLERSWGFGRPNFGEEPESDEIEPYIRLRLKNGVSVISVEGETTPYIDRIQLIFAKRDSVEWKRANGAIESGTVTVKGVLRLAVGGHHHEEAILNVESLTHEPTSQP